MSSIIGDVSSDISSDVFPDIIISPDTYTIKTIFIGPTNSGKTTLRHMIQSKDEIYDPSISYVPTILDFSIETIIETPQTRIRLNVFDTSGSENIKSITRSYYRGTGMAICVFDISNIRSFHQMNEWVDDFLNHYDPPLHSHIYPNNKRYRFEWDCEDEDIINAGIEIDMDTDKIFTSESPYLIFIGMKSDLIKDIPRPISKDIVKSYIQGIVDKNYRVVGYFELNKFIPRAGPEMRNILTHTVNRIIDEGQLSTIATMNRHIFSDSSTSLKDTGYSCCTIV